MTTREGSEEKVKIIIQPEIAAIRTTDFASFPLFSCVLATWAGESHTRYTLYVAVLGLGITLGLALTSNEGTPNA